MDNKEIAKIKEEREIRMSYSKCYRVNDLFDSMIEILGSKRQVALAMNVMPPQIDRFLQYGITYGEHVKLLTDLLGVSHAEFDRYNKGEILMTELLRPSNKPSKEIGEAEKKLRESLFVNSFLQDYYVLSGEAQKKVLRSLLGKEVNRLHLSAKNKENNLYEGYPEFLGFGDMSYKAFSCLARFKKIFDIVNRTVDFRYFLDNGCESKIYQEFCTYSDQNLIGIEWELPVFNSLASLLPRVRMWDKETPILNFQKTYANDLDQLIYDLVDVSQHSSISLIVNETIEKNGLTQKEINKGLELVGMKLSRWREIRLGTAPSVKPDTKELCYLAVICQDIEGLLPQGVWATKLTSSNTI